MAPKGHQDEKKNKKVVEDKTFGMKVRTCRHGRHKQA